MRRSVRSCLGGMERVRMLAPGIAALGIVLAAAAPAWAHGNNGEHLVVGYYFGHDADENPADPAWPATLLVDTHPWELGNVFFNMTPTEGGILDGYVGQAPGFEPLAVEDQEFGGHGFYSWLDSSYSLGTPHVELIVESVDPGLQILNPDTLLPITSFDFTEAFPHSHFTYYVPASENAELGDVYTATFHLQDLNNVLADSQSFTVQFEVAPEPGSLLLLLAAAPFVVTRRRAHC